MRRLSAIFAILFLCTGVFLGGCRRQAPKNDEDAKPIAIDPNVQVAPPPIAQGKNDDKQNVVALRHE